MTERSTVEAFCAKIGTDKLLVQAAGGNMSWKDGQTMWVKASGTWLSEAQNKDIFAPIDLQPLQDSMAVGDFHVSPKVLTETSLRPSIETLFHALIPHTFVLHTHSIEALATLVRADAKREIQSAFRENDDWIFVEYYKPGPELAEAIQTGLKRNPSAHIVFMKNHGIIIGANTIAEIEARLTSILRVLKHDLYYEGVALKTAPEIVGYNVVNSCEVQSLMQNPHLQRRIMEDWVLYPDHVIFLDRIARSEASDAPLHIYVPDVAVYERSNVTPAARAQLQCYADVIVRQPKNTVLTGLTETNVEELLNWDAEKFRQAFNN